MSTPLRPLPGAFIGIVGVLLLAALSRIPWDPGEAHAVIRLSWRTPGKLIEQCRELTQEELDALPIHMRRSEVCEGRLVPYRLHVMLDGEEVIEEMVRAAGAREDRPLYVLRDLPVEPGHHAIIVRWEPAGFPVEEDGEAHRTPEAEEERGNALFLTAEVRLEPRDISLITYDPNDRRLVVRGHSANR